MGPERMRCAGDLTHRPVPVPADGVNGTEVSVSCRKCPSNQVCWRKDQDRFLQRPWLRGFFLDPKDTSEKQDTKLKTGRQLSEQATLFLGVLLHFHHFSPPCTLPERTPPATVRHSQPSLGNGADVIVPVHRTIFGVRF